MPENTVKTSNRIWLKRAGWFSLFIGGGVLGLLGMAWPAVGTAPTDEELKTYVDSANFDTARGTFVNRRQDEYQKMMDSFDMPKLMKDQWFGKEVRTPPKPLPTETPDWTKWSEQKEAYIWFGHSTVLWRLDGKNILIDPVFDSAAPVSFAVPRFQEPVQTLDELPPIDWVIISHDHYDHLSYASMQFLKSQPNIRYFVPLGVSAYLKGWGIASSQITEMDWWDAQQVEGIQIACTPSQHFSGRTGPRGMRTLWASWVLKTESFAFYFSGDSGYDVHFKQIGEKYGPFDIAFMETGQYNPMWYMSHMFPEESAQGGMDLQAAVVHPIHWGTFKLSTHAWDDPVKRIVKKATTLSLPLSIPKQGQMVSFPLQEVNQDWYKTLQ